MKDFWNTAWDLLCCILASILLFAVVFACLALPAFLAYTADNCWWFCLYPVTLGIPAGFMMWDETER